MARPPRLTIVDTTAPITITTTLLRPLIARLRNGIPIPGQRSFVAQGPSMSFSPRSITMGLRPGLAHNSVYATLLGKPAGTTLTLKSFTAKASSKVFLLGLSKQLSWPQHGDDTIFLLLSLVNMHMS